MNKGTTLKNSVLSIFFLILLLGTFTSCSNDDNGISIETRNQLDDEAIQDFLSDFYFGENGRIMAFSEDDESDDNETPLLDLAEGLASGVWIVKNPAVTLTNTENAVDNDLDSILISYNQYRFVSNDGSAAEGVNLYGGLQLAGSTVTTSGSPQWDPTFYFSGFLDTDEFTDTQNPDLFEIEGFVEGLTQFEATGTGVENVPVFQGVIVVPSRLAFARDAHITGGQLTRVAFFDNSFVLEFELHRVVDRER